jgi:hypothetical protein
MFSKHILILNLSPPSDPMLQLKAAEKIASLAKENEDARQKIAVLESEVQARQALVAKTQVQQNRPFSRVAHTVLVEARVVPTPSPRKRQRVAAEPAAVVDNGSLMQQLRGMPLPLLLDPLSKGLTPRV